MITSVVACLLCLITNLGLLSFGVIGVGVVVSLLDSIISFLAGLTEKGMTEMAGRSIVELRHFLEGLQDRLKSGKYNKIYLDEAIGEIRKWLGEL
ncbi:MAG: hypothetical protein MOIL_01334 [Candidatus Methanolliviera sp. GoM_oil]|nr:MAG: hypothetical protein MOIL_01334 [Candidatus Methanolliviera sp. GoM_oil]